MLRLLLCVSALFSLMLPAAAANDADQPGSAPTIDVSKQNEMPAYPAMARLRSEKGTAVIYAKIDETGNVVKVYLAETSGYGDLDNSALAAVRNWHFRPATENGKPVEKWTAVGILFSMTGVKNVSRNLAPGFSEEKLAASDYNPEKVVCKQDEQATGSHLQGPKICHTQKEWDDISRSAQRDMERTVDDMNKVSLGGH